jgi:Flp pilus assembly protein TadG
VNAARNALPLVQQEILFAFVCRAPAPKNIMGKRLNRAVSVKDRFRRFGQRMRTDARKGSAAIEFAFVAPVFFALLMGIFEGAIMFFSQNVMQNAVTTVGRTLRTGQAACFTKTGTTCNAMTANDFRAQVCASAGVVLPGCAAALVVNSTRYTGGFGVGAQTSVTGADNGFTGAPCDVMVLRVTYPWKVVTPGATWFLVTSGADKHLIVTTLAFRNEPYGGASC